MDLLTDSDKIRVRLLDDKSDYTLWRIRVRAFISSRGLDYVFGDIVLEDQVTFTGRKRQANKIIMNALMDPAFRVLSSIFGNPKEMLVKLDARYHVKFTASKISRMSELVTVWYKSLCDDVARHIDVLLGIIEQLRLTKNSLENFVAIRTFISSIQVLILAAVTASIKAISERDLKWEDVSARLIEEVINLRYLPGSSFKANSASLHCQVCLHTLHSTEKCFLSTKNPDSKLQLPNGTMQQVLIPPKWKQDKGKNPTPSNIKQSESGTSVMAKAKRWNYNQTSDRMMLDSEITSHKAPFSKKIGCRKIM